MTQETLDRIHQEFLSSFKEASDVLGVFQQLHQQLDNLKEIPEEDVKAFDTFLSGLKLSALNREKTAEFTNLTLSIVTTIFYIIVFMNVRRSMDINANISARRKSLVREMVKILKKSIYDSSNTIGDRFGIKVVSLNNDRIIDLYSIYDYVSEILCNTNRQLRQEFIEFLHKTNEPLIIRPIDFIMSLNFLLIEGSFKDYVKDPKDDTGYQALHFRLQVDYSSSHYVGAIIEIQLRTQKMDKEAEIGKCNHLDYEDSVPVEIREVFDIPKDIFEGINIPSFTSFEPGIGDTDGFVSAKDLGTRSVSKRLVAKYLGL